MSDVVQPPSERSFRALLDPRGLLVHGAMRAPDVASVYTVFAQRTDARLDVAAIRNQAARFFDAKVGLTVDKRYDDRAPEVDVARVVVAGMAGETAGTRLCYGRPADATDLARARAAEATHGAGGLADLATRCRMVWLVYPETDDDRVALTLAAIFASVLLGPIVSPGEPEIYGVRTARLKLEGRSRPYR